MNKVWKSFRYGSLGLMASAIFVAIQGCDYKEIALSLLSIIALLLSLSGGAGGEHIEVVKVQTTVGVGNVFVSEAITFKVVVPDPSTVSSFDWTFGDGGTGTGQTVTHVYTSSGTFNISVIISRGGGQQTLSATLQIEDLQGPATLTVNGTGSGDITSSTSAINCTLTNGVTSGTCTDNVSLSATQVLTATPASGFILDNWNNCSNPSGLVCNHTVTNDVTISANFTQVFTLTVFVSVGIGSVVSDIGGINCPGVCTATFPMGTVVELTAIDGVGTFDQWNDCSNSSNRVINVTMNSDQDCDTLFII